MPLRTVWVPGSAATLLDWLTQYRTHVDWSDIQAQDNDGRYHTIVSADIDHKGTLTFRIECPDSDEDIAECGCTEYVMCRVHKSLIGHPGHTS